MELLIWTHKEIVDYILKQISCHIKPVHGHGYTIMEIPYLP